MVAIFKHSFDAVAYRVLQTSGVPFLVDLWPVDGARVLSFLLERESAWYLPRLALRVPFLNLSTGFTIRWYTPSFGARGSSSAADATAIGTSSIFSSSEPWPVPAAAGVDAGAIFWRLQLVELTATSSSVNSPSMSIATKEPDRE